MKTVTYDETTHKLVPIELVKRLRTAARALVRERKVYAEDVETLSDVIRIFELWAGSKPKADQFAAAPEAAGVEDAVMVKREHLSAVLTALDIATGDTDPSIDYDMSDDDVRQELPAVWAMQQIAGMLAAPQSVAKGGE